MTRLKHRLSDNVNRAGGSGGNQVAFQGFWAGTLTDDWPV